MEGLDPQRRELLEARISGKFFSDQITASSSQMTGSSSGDTNDKTPEKTASTRGRKRKGAATPDDVSLKSGRSSNQDGRQITKYFGSRDLAKSSSQSGSLSASKNSTSRDLFQLESNSAYRTNKLVQVCTLLLHYSLKCGILILYSARHSLYLLFQQPSNFGYLTASALKCLPSLR